MRDRVRELASELRRDLFGGECRGRVLLVAVCALATAFLLWSFGADVAHAVVIGACLGAVGIAWAAWPEHRPRPWHENTAPRDGGRWDVDRLSWSLRAYRGGRVGSDALRRVQALARTRLAQRQLDPLRPSDAAAIENLIGGAAFAVLRASAARTPTVRAISRCLDALDALDPENAYRPRRMAKRPRLRAMLHRLGRRPALTLSRRSPRRAN